jgi:hypothetical protein
MKRKVLIALVVLLALIVLAGRPHAFTDPMTQADGGVLATWGPVTCAVWTWSEPQVQIEYTLPVNCSAT